MTALFYLLANEQGLLICNFTFKKLLQIVIKDLNYESFKNCFEIWIPEKQ